jgi:hypothetical protein
MMDDLINTLVPYRPYKRVSERELEQADEAHIPFTQDRHNPKYLAEIVISNSKRRGKYLTRIQSRTLNEFHRERIFNLSSRTTHFDDHKVLLEYAKLYNHFFFFGSLKGGVQLILDSARAEDVNMNAITHHKAGIKFTWHFPFISGKATSRIPCTNALMLEIDARGWNSMSGHSSMK